MRGENITYVSVLLLLLAAFLIMIAGPEEADAVGSPAITVELAQSKQTAQITAEEGDIVTYTGTVYVQVPWSPEMQYVVVNLEGYVEGEDWPVSSPPDLVFSKQTTSQSFSMDVAVPSAALFDDYSFVIEGTWRYSPGTLGGTIPPTTGALVTTRYWGCDVSTDESFKEGERGTIVDMNFDIVNSGNGNDTFMIELTNGGELSGDRIEPYLQTDEVVVGGLSSREVTLSLDISERARLGDHDIQLMVRSRDGENEFGEELTAYLDMTLKVVEKTPVGDDDDDDDEPPAGDDDEPPAGDDDDIPDDDNGSSDGNGTGNGGEVGDDDGGGSQVSTGFLVGIIVIAVIILVVAYFLVRMTRKGSV